MSCRARLGWMKRSTRLHQLAHFCRVTSLIAWFAIRSKILDFQASIVSPSWVLSPAASISWFWTCGLHNSRPTAALKQLWACSTGLKNGEYGGWVTILNCLRCCWGTVTFRWGRAPSWTMKAVSLLGYCRAAIGIRWSRKCWYLQMQKHDIMVTRIRERERRAWFEKCANSKKIRANIRVHTSHDLRSPASIRGREAHGRQRWPWWGWCCDLLLR